MGAAPLNWLKLELVSKNDHTYSLPCMSNFDSNPVGQIAKKNSLKEYVFVNSALKKFGTQNTVPYCQKCAPTDCFFYDFSHWEIPANPTIKTKNEAIAVYY